ncbi:hypothetical protein OUZ56_008745 [Daphnia magna]|uniref:Secreted protein n=1 Tax=Daphnia magna TaxID=35525 RepID=A0ABR0ADY0_9CRUS|nr:hypothetical protein OUZ56_008745 [Daphnia magna]
MMSPTLRPPAVVFIISVLRVTQQPVNYYGTYVMNAAITQLNHAVAVCIVFDPGCLPGNNEERAGGAASNHAASPPPCPI